MIEDQFEIIDNNVKAVLGSEYSAENFTKVEEGYTDQQKTSYTVKFTFDLNKSYMRFDGKGLPGVLNFYKEGEEWKCNLNSGNAAGLFNIFR